MAEPWVINASLVILLAKAGLIQHIPVLAEPFMIPEPVASMGVILRLKRAGLISVVRPHLLTIREAGGFIGNKLFVQALTDAGEQP